MTRTVELLGTVAAGAAGATIAVLVVGASLLLVVPAVLGVVAIAVLAPRWGRRRPAPR